MKPRARLAVLIVLVACGCTATVETWEPKWRAPYASFDKSARAELKQAREAMARGDWPAAWAALTALAQADPDNIEVGRTLQEVELELIAAGSTLDPELRSISGEGNAEEGLRRLYAQRAEKAPSVAGYVLAARLETDAIAAENLLDRALELDPRCAWAHYGRAHALLRQGRRRDRWRLARESLVSALTLEPGHIHARRLEAWMLAQEGELRPAVRALQTWLEVTRDEVRLARAERIEAELDLATLFLLDGRVDESFALLSSLEGADVGRTRRLALAAVAAHELGDFEAARDYARRAEGAAGDPLLALVQQALLAQIAFGEDAIAEEGWRKVLEAAEERKDLGAILQAMRARVVLERARAQSGADDEREADGAADPGRSR